MNWLNRTIRQDKNIDAVKGYSRASFKDVGSTGAYDGGIPQLQRVRYAQAKEQPRTVRNLAKTNKVMRIAAETEKVYEENVYPIQRFSRKQRRAK